MHLFHLRLLPQKIKWKSRFIFNFISVCFQFKRNLSPSPNQLYKQTYSTIGLFAATNRVKYDLPFHKIFCRSRWPSPIEIMLRGILNLKERKHFRTLCWDVQGLGFDMKLKYSLWNKIQKLRSTINSDFRIFPCF